MVVGAEHYLDIEDDLFERRHVWRSFAVGDGTP